MPDLYETIRRAGGAKESTWRGMKLFVLNPNTGHVLANFGGDVPHDPASLTKLMTYYRVLKEIKSGALHLEQKLTVSHTAATRNYGYLLADQTLTVEQAIRAMMVASDNSAATLLSEVLGNNNVERMNETAKRLGLNATRFVNADGLPVKSGPVNTTTARDMAVLISTLYREFPAEMKQVMDLPDVGADVTLYDYKNRPYLKPKPADNFLNRPGHPLQMPEAYCTYAKAGFTDRAGHNIASITECANNDNSVVVVALGAGWKPKTIMQEVGMTSAQTGSEKRAQ